MVKLCHAQSGDPNSVNTLNNMIGGNHAMVLYYMTGCGHCEMMKPEWIEFEQEAVSMPFEIIIARVNRDVMDNVRADHDVLGFPTIYHLYDGKKQREFESPRSKEEFHRFLEEISKEQKRTLKDRVEELQKLEDEINGLLTKPTSTSKSKSKSHKSHSKSKTSKSKKSHSKSKRTMKHSKKHTPTPYPKQTKSKTKTQSKKSVSKKSKSKTSKSKKHSQKGYPFSEIFSLE